MNQSGFFFLYCFVVALFMEVWRVDHLQEDRQLKECYIHGHFLHYLQEYLLTTVLPPRNCSLPYNLREESYESSKLWEFLENSRICHFFSIRILSPTFLHSNVPEPYYISWSLHLAYLCMLMPFPGPSCDLDLDSGIWNVTGMCRQCVNYCWKLNK